MNYEKIQGLLDSRGYKELKEEMEKYYPVDIAALLEEVDEKEMLILFRLLAKEEAAETFTYMNALHYRKKKAAGCRRHQGPPHQRGRTDHGGNHGHQHSLRPYDGRSGGCG